MCRSSCFSCEMEIKHLFLTPTFHSLIGSICWNVIFPNHFFFLLSCTCTRQYLCDHFRDLFFCISAAHTDQDVPRCYSAMDGRHTLQSRRPASDREVKTPQTLTSAQKPHTRTFQNVEVE